MGNGFSVFKKAVEKAIKAGMPKFPVRLKRKAKMRFGRTAASSRTRAPVGRRRRKMRRAPGK